MNTSRRELLKFFAAGTVITPLGGGATAKLIEPPKAQIIKPPTVVSAFTPRDIEAIEITFTMKDGSRRTLHREDCPIAYCSAHAVVPVTKLEGELILTQTLSLSPSVGYPLLTASIDGLPV